MTGLLALALVLGMVTIAHKDQPAARLAFTLLALVTCITLTALS